METNNNLVIGAVAVPQTIACSKKDLIIENFNNLSDFLKDNELLLEFIESNGLEFRGARKFKVCGHLITTSDDYQTLFVDYLLKKFSKISYKC